MIYDKICHYCQQVVPHRPLEQMESRNIKVYFCATCQAEYTYFPPWNEGDLAGQHLYVTINNQLYRWSLGGPLKETAYLWHIREPGIPGVKPNRKTKLLKHFDKGEQLDINPQNIEAKIKFMLLFL